MLGRQPDTLHTLIFQFLVLRSTFSLTFEAPIYGMRG